MRRGILPAIAIFTVAVTPEIFGCDVCAIYSAHQAQGGERGFFAGAAEQFTYFGTLKDNNQDVPGNGEYIDSSVTQIFAGYNFNSRFGLQFNLPLIYRSYGSSTASGNESGPGDASLIGNVVLYRLDEEHLEFIWTALGGVKFPTGDSYWLGQPDFAPGIGGHDLALGSGSFDGLVGTGFSLRLDRWFLDGQMQYGIRTEGDFQHQYANEWTWSGGPGAYLVLNDNYTVALQLAVSGETKGDDTFAGVADPDSAATIVYLGPEIRCTVLENFSAHVGVDIPVSIDESGEQLVPDYRIHGAVTWQF